MDDVVKSLSTRLSPAADKPADRPSREEAEAAVRTLIRWAGDDPQREGLRETPKRVAKAFRELYSGYKDDPGEVLDKIFAEVEGYDDMVLVRDIPFYSHCEHHMVPFFGMAHIALVSGTNAGASPEAGQRALPGSRPRRHRGPGPPPGRQRPFRSAAGVGNGRIRLPKRFRNRSWRRASGRGRRGLPSPWRSESGHLQDREDGGGPGLSGALHQARFRLGVAG